MVLFIISLIASTTSVFSLLPQIYHTYRSKSAKDLSLLMLINFLVCSLSWVFYGCITHMFLIWITNGLMTIFSIILIVFKIRFDPKENLP